MKMHDFLKVVGSLTLASIDILVPACFVMAISSHHKVSAVILGIAMFIQWIREAMITYLISEDKVA